MWETCLYEFEVGHIVHFRGKGEEGDETGGSLSMCVLGGDWRFPDEGRGAKKPADGEGITESVKEVVRRCLKVKPGERPDVDELIALKREKRSQHSF